MPATRARRTTEGPREIDELVDLLKLPAAQDDHQLRQLASQAHQQIHSTLLSNENTTSLSDQEILDRLTLKEELAQKEFQAADSQRMIGEARQEIQTLKPQSEQIHEEYMRHEDEYIDHHESLKPGRTPSAPTSQKRPQKPGLVEALAGQIGWLKELGRLKLWFGVLLDFRDRTAELVHQATHPDGRAAGPAPARETEALADQIFELIQSYQDFRRLAPPNNNVSRFTLYDYIHQIIRHALSGLIEAIAGHLAQTLEDEIAWPQPSRAPLEFKAPSTTRILASFKTAVNFQNKLNSRPDLVSLAEQQPERADQDGVVWLPLAEGSILLKAILRPIILRFRFHFDSSRPTNRLDKPEWYFNHVLDRLAEHEKFIKSDIQKLFEMSGQGSTKVFHGFTVQLIKIVEKKLKRRIPRMLEMKPILAHTIESAIAFDQTIKQMGYLSSEPSTTGYSAQWLGTADAILSNPHWFSVWFEAEKRFVDDMCLEIISSNDTWEINEEDQRPMSMGLPGTNSSLGMQDLVEQIKSKYELLPRLSYQTAFLVKIQMVVLEAYSQRIGGVLDGFERSRLISVVGGDSGRAKMNVGMKGLERLVKVYISCNWLLACFRTWNDDLFYAELYDKLGREESPSPELDKLLRSVEAAAGLDRTLFSLAVARFEELAKRAEAAIVRQVVQEISAELKPYFAKRWDLESGPETEGSGGGAAEVDELSPEIVPAIGLWKARMNYLRGTVGPRVKLNRLVKPIAQEIEAKLLLKMVFEPFSIRAISHRGGLQIQFDLLFGWLNTTTTTSLSADRSTQPLRLERHFSKVLDACKLLTCPSASSPSSVSAPLMFEELVRICFDEASPERECKRLLKERVQVSCLSRSECQLVLKRRPECWKT
ncbi:hypothetical protein PtA15_5A883 [Puccinia triticina]|uniref:RAD50-interacting protein 1 n=1 Tax=Puccinia triticina TaxID=208348 RepID=A0ABY7CK73_9BASI|nr:uncharacterized protein PtA15_5A883 [Puccinia triticina]WAQ85308.1 hypothetical protein PtA15_5A883 [Puccinia triticina]